MVSFITLWTNALKILMLGGAWSQYQVGPESEWSRMPSTLTDIGFGATISIPSTAFRMLTDFQDLQPGDTVIQNGATSAVGLAAIQIASAMQIKTINLIRRGANKAADQAVVDRLKEYGADEVIFEDQLSDRQLRARLKLMAPKLGFNCIGGKSSETLAKLMSQQGVIVTYGGMSKQPVSIPTGLLIFSDLVYRGFWLTRWVREASREERERMMDTLVNLHADGKLQTPATIFPAENWKEAIAHATREHKTTKAVLAWNTER